MKWEIAQKFSEDLRTQLLHNRGISPDSVGAFLNPNLLDYNENLKIPELDKARARILEAVAKNEKIAIFGDYDVDGICSSAIVYIGLKSIGADIKPFIPHRMEHGYGLSKSGIDELLKLYPGVSLIITVDNGVSAHDGLEYAKKMGLEVIVTDHHEKGDQNPNAYALVHTTEMCGSGVAWILINEIVEDTVSDNLLQLAAVGTIADMMPMLGVNRAIVAQGLEALRKKPNLGLRMLADRLDINISNISAEVVSYKLIPKMNATGRVDSAMPALRMLCFDNLIRVQENVEVCLTLNVERQDLTKKAIEEAKLQLDDGATVNVVRGNWHPGVVGLVAQRLVEISHKPTLVIAEHNGSLRGSARSVDGINIIKMLRGRRELFSELGGHSGAAGFGLSVEAFGTIKEWLFTVDLPRREEAVLNVDALVLPSQINERLIKVVEELSPFGVGNPVPVFASLDANIRGCRRIGTDGSHLKMNVGGVDAIGFGMGKLVDEIEQRYMTKIGIDVAYHLEINEFNGRRIPQMKLIDVVLR